MATGVIRQVRLLIAVLEHLSKCLKTCLWKIIFLCDWNLHFQFREWKNRLLLGTRDVSISASFQKHLHLDALTLVLC